jgi:hypothetical protein
VFISIVQHNRVGKELDLTESSKSFLTLLESKKSKADSDIQWVIVHNNKKEIATLLKMKE